MTTAHVQFIKKCEQCKCECAIEKTYISGYKGGFEAVDVPEGTEQIVIFCHEYWSRQEYGVQDVNQKFAFDIKDKIVFGAKDEAPIFFVVQIIKPHLF